MDEVAECYANSGPVRPGPGPPVGESQMPTWSVPVPIMTETGRLYGRADGSVSTEILEILERRWMSLHDRAPHADLSWKTGRQAARGGEAPYLSR